MHAQGAAATDTPRLASSRYRLTRQLSPDMTSSVHLSFFLHSSCCLVRSFSYTPRIICFIEEFLLHSSNWFSEEFLLHSSGHLFYGGVSLRLLKLLLLRSFSYTPRAGLVRSFSYTPRAGLVRSFSYTLRAGI